MAELLCLKELPSGAVLLHEGEPGSCFYFILEGQLNIVKAMGTAEERLLGVRGPGEFIGEMSLFNPAGLRTASIFAAGPVLLSEMSHSDFYSHPASISPIWLRNCFAS